MSVTDPLDVALVEPAHEDAEQRVEHEERDDDAEGDRVPAEQAQEVAEDVVEVDAVHLQGDTGVI